MNGILTAALLLGGICSAPAFALLGQFKGAGTVTGEPWQDPGFDGRPQGLGYSLAGDIGGPMFAHEAYRWAVPNITYAFDSSFLRFFGTNGVAAVEGAIAILNALPPASQLSPTLDEYPLDTKGENAQATALGLLDLKSRALALLVEELGLANPERFVFGLRSRETGQNFTNYAVIQMNYDPVTITPSRYVNGVLYNYVIFDDLGPQGGEWASAIEWYQLDPLRIPYSSVAGLLGGADLTLGAAPDLSGGALGLQGMLSGQYISGLTRDDVGGLRYLLNPNNIVYETLLPTVVPASVTSGNSAWGPIFGTNVLGATNVPITNVLGTNVLAGFVRTGLRPGVDKLTFHRVNFDSILGTTFTPITNRYTDLFINTTNGRVIRQKVSRAILFPDIVFGLNDLDTVDEVPFLAGRTDTTGWSNNAALNTVFVGINNLGGPGTITPGITIRFSDLVPFYLNVPGGTDADFPLPITWGSFDGSDRPPVVYPIFQHPLMPQLSLEYLQSLTTRRRN
ncbi:MAG TPA: hypothetical protein VJS65_07455 [Verrucomicrobiae bacterium]|nr:hypothetical protein [Verrucomicrobiae bacterium]